MTVFMFAFASKQSFWVDELDWMIGIITGKSVFNGRLFTGMFQILLEQGYNLPLYYIIEKPFYELLPYGETFLLIPSIVFVVIDIIILGKAGTLIGVEDIGFIAVCIAVTSTTLITQGGWEIRPYSITFCFSSLVLLMYVKRLNAETNRNVALYGISVLLLLYSHWFGSILALFCGFTDLWLCIRKKIAFKCIFAYILAGVFFMPWFLLMVFHHVNDLSSYWSQIPRIIEPVLSVAYLLSNTVLYCLLFGIGFVIVLFKRFHGSKKETALDIWFFMGVSIIWVILPVFVYSKFINQTGSFYVQKYFFVIMPHVFLITGYGVLEAFRSIQRRFFTVETKKKYLYCFVMVLFCFTGFRNYQKAYINISSIQEPYRETAEYLTLDKQVYSDNSLVICSGGTVWIEYYFNKRGFAIPANLAFYSEPMYKKSEALKLFIDDGHYIQPIPLSADQLSKYDCIYLFEVHALFTEEFIGAIEQQYILKDDRPEFAPSVLEENFLRKTIKNILHIRSEIPKRPFGIRIYAKNV